MRGLIFKYLFVFISFGLIQIPVASAAVIASAAEQGMIFFLYDVPCDIPNLASRYPWRWDVTNPSTNQNLSRGCYSLNKSSQVVTMVDANNTVGNASFAEFGLGNQYQSQSQSQSQSQQSALGATADFFNSIANGIAGAQKFQQPPPGFVYIPPGTSRSNYMTCTPDGRGGYYCK